MNPMTYLIINGALFALLWTGALEADSRRYDAGTGCGACHLRVPDIGGACETRKPDRKYQ